MLKDIYSFVYSNFKFTVIFYLDFYSEMSIIAIVAFHYSGENRQSYVRLLCDRKHEYVEIVMNLMDLMSSHSH